MRKPLAANMPVNSYYIIVLDELSAIPGQTGRAQTGTAVHLKSPEALLVCRSPCPALSLGMPCFLTQQRDGCHSGQEVGERCSDSSPAQELRTLSSKMGLC